MSRGYGRSYRKGFPHTSIQFDKLFKENSNRPSAARSAGTVGKWGITSFTSIRTSNGYPGAHYTELTAPRPKPTKVEAPTRKDPFSFEPVDNKQNDSVPVIQPVKPKKFFKSRNADTSDKVPSDVCSDSADITYSPVTKKPKVSYGGSRAKVAARSSASKKFFPSKRVPSPTPQSSKREDGKPPIVLRIIRGKSQLLSDSDESESTPTPSSATITSPRSTSKDIQVPVHIRVTRSTRRSMQQDLGNSPATAETPTDTFSSLLSPQYIPAEKYELERKAMYANLLGPLSPTDSAVSVTTSQETVAEPPPEPTEPPEEIKDDELIDSSGIESQELVCSPLPLDDTPDEPQDLQTSYEASSDKSFDAQESAIENSPIQETESNEPKKLELEEWSDSDSDSSQPNMQPTELDTAENFMDFSLTEEHREELMDKILEKPIEPVKIVISKKKGSIFKSRALVAEGASKKRHALYKHKWCDDRDQAQKGASENSSEKEKEPNPAASPFDEFGFESAPLTRVTRSTANEYLPDDVDTVTSVKCTKKDKDYYTVVRNVKKAHQIQEIGEFQEFNDDVEYILDALQDNNPISTRCLSAITLATKCMAPAFRMHVRAHGIVAKFFKALHDATKDQSLGLCTATVMFVLSQERLNMDLDRDCLELMLNLLESDVSYQKALDECGLSSAQLHKNKLKVRELCAEIQSQGHAMHLNLENITVGQLAMETLLSLTSKRAGEWFKEELRELGGLQHIMETICECCRQVSDYVVVWTDVLLDKLRKVDRCMRVLENVTHNNEQNQTYLLEYNNGLILDTLVKLYRLCDAEIPLYPVTDISDKDSTGTVIREALLVTLKVLINLTHHYSKKSMGSTLIGSKQGILEASLHLLLQVPHYIPEQKKFELGVLVSMLLINLIQDNENNKKLLVDAKAPAECESIFPCDKSALEALIAHFYHCEELARVAGKRTDAILDGEKDQEEKPQQPKSHEEFIEETVAKLLQKAGTHMEFTFLASYIVMLIGFLIMDNNVYEMQVRKFLNNQSFNMMIEILKKFFNFMNLTASTEASSMCQIKATEKVIKYMEDCEVAVAAAAIATTSNPDETLNLSKA